MKKLRLDRWIEINADEYDGLIHKMIHQISIIKDLEPHIVSEWDVDDILSSYEDAKWITTPINDSDAVNELKVGELKLHLIDFNNITFGQFIDLEYYIEEGYIEHISEIVATLYLQMEKVRFKKSIYERYGDVDIDERAGYIASKIYINDVYGKVKSFLKWRDNIFASYNFWDDSLEGVDPNDLNEEEMAIYKEEMERIEKSKLSMWQDMLHMLSNGDITKYDDILGTNIFMVFNRIAKTVEDNRNQTKTK